MGALRSVRPADRHQPCGSADEAIITRRSIRAFLDKPVSLEMVQEILDVAARAPSGTNTQPWKVHVVGGELRKELSRRILAVFDDPEQAKTHSREYQYYPKEWTSPYIDRRRKVGWVMYGLMGSGWGVCVKTECRHGRNFPLFESTVGLMLPTDRMLEQSSWLDNGLFN